MLSRTCSIPSGYSHAMLLSQLADNLALSVEPFGLCEVEAGCELDLGDYQHTIVHFGLAGCGAIERAGVVVEVSQNSLVIVPGGVRHRMWTNDENATAEPRLAHVAGLTHLQAFGDRNEGDFISACGQIQARYGDGPRLFDHLREPLLFDFSGREDVQRLFEQMLAESAGFAAGSRQMLAALMNRCLLLMFRELCEDDHCPLPWLSALENEHLAAALHLMLTQPGHVHSVESLAEAASMSRTVFAEHFHAAFGAPPMTFLRDVRLRRAAALLHEGRHSVAQVAAAVGFSSRAHFATAFRKRFGEPPSAYRRRQ